MAAVLRSILNSVQVAVRLFLTLAAVLVGLSHASGDGGSPLPPSIASAPLSVDQVVDNLVRRDRERARDLRHYESTRVYRLAYRGFPSNRDAEMTVHAIYNSPSTKTFEVTSQTGSKLIIERVFKRLLESEKEALEPELHSRTLLNRDNYDIALIGFEPSARGNQYVLEVNPKSKSKYVYRGKVWVDATDFAVTRIDAEPAQNPSFWTKKSEIHHEYMKVQGFWLPRRNESVSYVRLGGRATLTIDYTDYRALASAAAASTTNASSTEPR